MCLPLILHGDTDQIVPIDASAKLVKNATLKVYPRAPHGKCTTLADPVNADLLTLPGGLNERGARAGGGLGASRGSSGPLHSSAGVTMRQVTSKGFGIEVCARLELNRVGEEKGLCWRA
jgi:hypothetical protein